MSATDKLILGTVQFGLEYGINNRHGKPSEHQVAAILDKAFANGIRLLDTAEAYGNSQEVIGRYHRSSSNRFGVITKYSAGRSDLPERLSERISLDLAALQIPSLYGYMFHSYRDFEMYYPTYCEEIEDLKQKGLITKFGVSVYTNEELEKLLSIPVDFVQLPFNILDNRQQRGQSLEKAKAKGIEIHTRSAFLQGLFFMQELPEKLKPLKPYLALAERLAETHGSSLPDMALNYAIEQRFIDHVLIGVDTVDQLDYNLMSLSRGIPNGLTAQLDAILVKESSLLNPSTWNS